MLNRQVLLMTLALVIPSAVADVFDQHLWQDRLLILAAPYAEHPELQLQRRAIEDQLEGMAERRLRVYQLIGDQGLLDDQPLDNKVTTRVREWLALKKTDSVMLLLGLDGEVKRRTSLATPLSQFFTQIDAMPMRQAEIRARQAAQPCLNPDQPSIASNVSGC